MANAKKQTKEKKEVKNYVVVEASAGGTEGLYKSTSGPAAAAKKAATKRFKAAKVTTVTLTLRATGSDRLFTYTATRVKLAKPFVSTIAGKEVVREYATEVKKAKLMRG